MRDVYLALSADLAKRGRADWVGEEMEVLTSPETYRADPETAWERLKTRVRKPKELAVLMEIAAWREREAQTRDVPRGRVLKDDVLGEIATQAPATKATNSPKARGMRYFIVRPKEGIALRVRRSYRSARWCCPT